MLQVLVGNTDMGSVLPMGSVIVQEIHEPRDLANKTL
jgi:hypothetical protein